MQNIIPSISLSKVEEIIKKGLYLIVKREGKRYIRFLCDVKIMEDSNKLYELLFLKDVKSNYFGELKDCSEEIERVYSGTIYYDKEYTMSTILSQLPITVQDSIYAIEIVNKNSCIESHTGATESVIIYKKKCVPKEIHNNNLALGGLYYYSKNIDYYYVKGDSTYLLDCKDEFFSCLNLSIEDIFKKYGKKERKSYNSNYAEKVYLKNNQDYRGIEFIDFLKQLPATLLRSPNGYIVIKSPFEYTDLNKHKYIDESREGYLVYEYYTNV